MTPIGEQGILCVNHPTDCSKPLLKALDEYDAYQLRHLMTQALVIERQSAQKKINSARAGVRTYSIAKRRSTARTCDCLG